MKKKDLGLFIEGRVGAIVYADSFKGLIEGNLDNHTMIYEIAKVAISMGDYEIVKKAAEFGMKNS